MSERLVLLAADPTVHPAGSRGEIDLTDGGPIQVAGSEGPQFGAATVELFTAEAEYGADAIDRTFPLRPGEIPLAIMATDTESFDDGRRQIQAWVGLVQETGRAWIQRDTAAGTLYSEVVKAELRLGADNLAAWGLADANALLTIEANPEWFGEEVLLGSGTITGGGAVRLDNVPGDYLAQARIVIEERSGVPQRGLLFAARPENPADTAKMEYRAVDLTPLGGAEIVTDGPLPPHIEAAGLPAAWVATVSTDIAGVGPMSHVGTHQVWVHASGFGRIRFEWSSGSNAAVTQNAIRDLAPGSSWLDLGTVRLDELARGDQRWSGRILADVTETLFIYTVLVLPVDDAYGQVNAQSALTTGSEVAAWDGFAQHAAGVLDGKVAPVGGTWDEVGASGSFLTTGAFSDGSGFVVRQPAADGPDPYTDGRFAVLPTNQVETDATAAVRSRYSWLFDAEALSCIAARWVDAENYLLAGAMTQLFGTAVLVKVVGGVPTVLDLGIAVSPFTVNRMRVTVDGSGNATLYVNDSYAAGALADPDLATGGVLARGGVGFYDYCSSRSFTDSNYDSLFVSSSPTVLDAVLYENDEAELSTWGYQRAVGGAFAPLVVVGDLPRLPTSGATRHPVEVYVRLSRQILGSPFTSDESRDQSAVRVYGRPCYLFTG